MNDFSTMGTKVNDISRILDDDVIQQYIKAIQTIMNMLEENIVNRLKYANVEQINAIRGLSNEEDYDFAKFMLEDE